MHVSFWWTLLALFGGKILRLDIFLKKRRRENGGYSFSFLSESSGFLVLLLALVPGLGLVLLKEIERREHSMNEGDCYDPFHHLRSIPQIASSSFLISHLASQS